ncbi:MAG: hypothetical protein ACOVOS_06545, partial [Chitinophagaceae bacterium]
MFRRALASHLTSPSIILIPSLLHSRNSLSYSSYKSKNLTQAVFKKVISFSNNSIASRLLLANITNIHCSFFSLSLSCHPRHFSSNSFKNSNNVSEEAVNQDTSVAKKESTTFPSAKKESTAFSNVIKKLATSFYGSFNQLKYETKVLVIVGILVAIFISIYWDRDVMANAICAAFERGYVDKQHMYEDSKATVKRSKLEEELTAL